MKKIILIAAMFTVAPVFAACSITGGACSISDPTPVSKMPSLEDKYVPHYLQNLQKPAGTNPQINIPKTISESKTETERFEEP